MKHRVSIGLILMAVAVLALRVQAAINVPLTIQEALYPGSVAGVTRSADPVTVGIPLPDDPTTGATDVSQLTLSGANVGQFRVLGRWPSGRIKWVLVDTLASVSPGGTATGIALSTGGTGNFGGSDLATDNGATITVATGTATFTIKKANFNGFDRVVVGSTTVVASGASQGLVVMGPPPGQTTCGTCNTIYSSANDASSTAVIEENGPVRTVIRATGAHKDGSGNAYMKFTVRMHFYRNQTHVKAVTSLRNADLGGNNSFASAYKGFEAYEWRIAPTLSGTPNYRIGKDSGAEETGTLTAGTSDVELYSAQSEWMESTHWGGFGTVDYTLDAGWRVRKDGGDLDTGTTTDYVAGWADIRGASDGAGVQIGVYQLAGYWPKSLEFNDAGTDTRIGIWPRQSSQPFYQAWPQYSTHDLFFNFHASALSSPSGEFLKLQHPLIARAPLAHYNTTAVFPYPIVDPAAEDAFFASTHATANPANLHPFVGIQDASPNGVNTSGGALKLAVVRWFNWGSGGESTQQEFRYGWMMNWLQRGLTGRYLAATQFYRFQVDQSAPRSDGFNWRDQTGSTDLQGKPAIVSINSSLAHRVWYDQDHPHWYGMPDYYMMTGDETVKDAILDGYLDYHLNTGAIQAGLVTGSRDDGMYDNRAAATVVIAGARLAVFLNAIGNTTDAATVLANATSEFESDIKTTLCTNAEQASQGCTASDWPDSRFDEGISRTRGMYTAGGGAGSWCGDEDNDGLRISSTWAGSAFAEQGLIELSNARGASWSDYWLARDLTYGMAQGHFDEGFVEFGNNRWDQDHWRESIPIDRVGTCQSPPPAYDDRWIPHTAPLSLWMQYYSKWALTGDQSWVPSLRIALLRAANYTGPHTADFYGYTLGAAIHAATTPPPARLQPVSINQVVDNGSGSYTIHWTVPSGAQSYRIKWGAKQIVEWIGFAPETNTFIGNPNTTMNWFAATNVPTPPAPAAAGTTQSLTIATGRTGLTAANFSVKFYSGGGSQTTPPSPTATNLVLVSGNNQTGTAGTALGAPLTVKVTNSGGSPVGGVNVSFAVAGGGGTLSGTLVATNGSGLASSILTLGSAAGTNTVTAASGTLAGSPVTFTAVASSAGEGQPVPITPNNWVNVVPRYEGAPNGGVLTPMSWNNIGVYDPASKRTISFERWQDPIRGLTIYANALPAYDPGTNTVTVLKLTNWANSTSPLPANTTDPTPIDRHSFGGIALVPNIGAVYLVNGANQAGRPTYYPDHPNDTWKFSLASSTWTKVADAATGLHPPTDVGNYSGMVYDPPTGKLAYFVVQYPNGTRTWLFDPGTNRWSAAPADETAKNVYISGAGIAYDSRRNQVLAYAGGDWSDAGDSAKLWAYSVGQNKWTALQNAPIAATAPEFAYDSVHDVFLALVGQRTLIYNPRTNAWSQLAATIDRGAQLNRQNVTYNSAHDVFVYQGGTWDKPVWSLFRYSDVGSPPGTTPAAPFNLRIVR